MVINNNPSYAYLLRVQHGRGPEAGDGPRLRARRLLQETTIRSSTPIGDDGRDGESRHGLRRIIDKVGIEPVETFIDRCLSLENLINQHAPHFPAKSRDEAPDRPSRFARGFKTDREYMSQFSTRRSSSTSSARNCEEERRAEEKFRRSRSATCCVLIEPRHIERWEAERALRDSEEAYYFAPQGETKICNEGWASYWHSTIIPLRPQGQRDRRLRRPPLGHHGKPAPAPSIPYKLGIELWRHIEDRWNKKAASGKNGRVRRPARPTRVGQEARPGPAEDLRGAQALQRRHLHRRVPHRGLRGRAEALRLRLQREGEPLGESSTASSRR